MNLLSRRISKIKATVGRQAYAKRMMHPAFTHLLINAPIGAVRTQNDEAQWSDELLKRISDYHAWSHTQTAGTTASMWDEHERRRKSFIDALNENDTKTLRENFSTLFHSILLDGMSHGNSLFALEERNPYQPNFFPLRTLDCLLSFAEAVGAKSVPSYAQMKLLTYIKSLQPDYDALLADIESRIGFSLDMPTTGSPYVCKLGKERETAVDVIRHGYVAHRLKELDFKPDSRIVEIGGGYGIFALCAHRAGFRNFTIIDLPFVGAIQMGYLGASLGPDAVAGGHEPASSINIVPPEAVNDIEDKSVDVCVNCDSLPDMGRETALSYLHQIRRTSRYFFSINQEAQKVHGGAPQNWVSELAEEVGGLRRVYRFRDWMEQGYTEELYECT